MQTQSIGLLHWLSAGVMAATVLMIEIVWDIRDIEGDRSAGVRTLPVVRGIGAARCWLSIINGASGAVVSTAIWAAGLQPVLYFLLAPNLFMALLAMGARNAALGRRSLSHALVLLQFALLVGLGLIVAQPGQ